MRRIESDEDLQRIWHEGRGLVYNDYTGTGASGWRFNILHAASCRWIQTMETHIPKYFFEDLNDAVRWLTSNRGPERECWRRCDTCNAEPTR